jgi:Protein of unknown function (DUF4231)
MGAHFESEPVWERLEEQLRFYDEGATRNRLAYQLLKVIQLIVAAAIPVAAAAGGGGLMLGVLGGLVVVFEGVQQVFQFQKNWVSYRSTSEGLKQEKYLFLSEAGDYDSAPRPLRLLAERVETLSASEHTGWATARREPISNGTAAVAPLELPSAAPAGRH